MSLLKAHNYVKASDHRDRSGERGGEKKGERARKRSH